MAVADSAGEKAGLDGGCCTVARGAKDRARIPQLALLRGLRVEWDCGDLGLVKEQAVERAVDPVVDVVEKPRGCVLEVCFGVWVVVWWMWRWRFSLSKGVADAHVGYSRHWS